MAHTNPSQITENEDLTGSVSRSLASKLSDTVSVKDFGAVCDGTTDDATKVQAALTAMGALGGTLLFPGDTKVASALTLTVTSGKTLFIDLGGHKLTLAHTSGVGLTIDGNSFRRQPLVISNGTISGNTTSGVTGVKVLNAIQFTARDLLVTGFTGTSQVVWLLDGTEDSEFSSVNFLENNNTGTIALDLTNNANANKYSNVQFQNNTTAIRIRNGSSGNWFSDCLIQSNVATNAVVVQSLTADTNTAITDTVFERCWFENNGDSTANASSVAFTADVGRTIAYTRFISNHFNGNVTGASGVAFRFSGAGTPAGVITTVGNNILNYAAAQSGLANGSYGWTSINDDDHLGTLQATVSLAYPGQNKGITFAPTGASKKWLIYGGSPADNDGKLEFFDLTAGAEILRYGGTWVFPKDISMSAARITFAQSAPSYGVTVAINAGAGDQFTITATNGVGFTVSNPINAPGSGNGQRIQIRVKNTSGGALGALTWDTLYKLSAWAQPANGQSRSIDFVWDGTNWVEAARTPADVPN